VERHAPVLDHVEAVERGVDALVGSADVTRVRVSRPNYDKMHRCPGWSGGGMLYAKVSRCDGGSLAWNGDEYVDIYAGRWCAWRVNRCSACGVYVLPSVVRWLDWRWLAYRLTTWLDDLARWLGEDRG
jgi:hypothetical protein